MNRVTPAVGGHDVGERRTISLGIQLHAIADARSVFRAIDENAGDRTRSDVYHIVDRTASVGKSGTIADQEAQTFLASNRSRWNAGVET